MFPARKARIHRMTRTDLFSCVQSERTVGEAVRPVVRGVELSRMFWGERGNVTVSKGSRADGEGRLWVSF